MAHRVQWHARLARLRTPEWEYDSRRVGAIRRGTVRQITEAVDVPAPPEVVFTIFCTPDAFVSCRPGITRFVQLTDAEWKAGAKFQVRGTFGSEGYRAEGKVTLLNPPCNFGFLIREGLGPLRDYQETYRMTFAGTSFTLIVNAQYVLSKGLTVGMMDRLVFHRRLQGELRQVLANVSDLATKQARALAKKRRAAAANAPTKPAAPDSA